MRIIVAECSAKYTGRLDTSLMRAKRVILVKADSSVLIFSEMGSYKPLNWMVAPCTIRERRMRSTANSAVLPGDRPLFDDVDDESQDSPLECAVEAEVADVFADTLFEQETLLSAKTPRQGNSEVEERCDALVTDSTDSSAALLSDTHDSAHAAHDGDVASAPSEVHDNNTSDVPSATSDDLQDNYETLKAVYAEDVPEVVMTITAKKSDDVLELKLYTIYSDEIFDLGIDSGLIKDGVEDQLQQYLAEQIERIGEGAKLIRREFPTPIGPVDIMAVDGDGQNVAIEIKRVGGIDGVEQLTRYCELLNRDPLLAPVRGIFAAQRITPQAKTLAEDRGFTCMILDYDDMKQTEHNNLLLF